MIWAIYQLNGNDKKAALKKYGNYYEFSDSMTIEEFQSKIHMNSDKVVNQINSFVSFILDLLEADSLDEFKQKYADLKYHNFNNPINDNSKKWKEQVLCCNSEFWNVRNWRNDLFQELRFTNLYLLSNAFLNIFYEKLLDFQLKYTSRKERLSMSNCKLVECDKFKQIIGELGDCIRYIQLQIRVNDEIGTFGSCHCKGISVRMHRIKDVRELLKVMIEFLFYGVSTKIGKKDENRLIKEIRSDIVYKYLNGEQKKFTDSIRNALYYRVRYSLYPRERADGKETVISPQQFGELLWQFFYYAFGADFYMLRMDNSDDRIRKEYWCDLVKMIFSMIMQGKTMQELDKMVNRKFVRFQFKIEGKFISRFTPDEIEFFKHQEVIGLTNYEKLYERAMMGEKDDETQMLASEIMRRLIEVKIASILDKASETMELISHLLRTENAESFKYYGEYRMPL